MRASTALSAFAAMTLSLTVTTSALSAPTTPEASHTVDHAAAPAGRHVVVKQPSGFALPSGNIFCVLWGENGAASASSVTCEILKKSYTTAPQKCVDDGMVITKDDRYITLAGTRPADIACFVHESVSNWAIVGPFAPSKFTTWYNAKLDLKVKDRGGEYGALRYGSTMTWGDFRCAVSTKGVTCSNTKTKHGLFLSRETLRTY